MKRIPSFGSGVIATLIVTIAGTIHAQQGDASKAAGSDATRLVYADFQSLHNGRPVSKRGGLTRLNKYAQNMANAPRVRGLENADPPSPAPARVTDQDTAAAFEYELRMPNEWAGVNMEVFGQPEKDGKLVADEHLPAQTRLLQPARVGAALGLQGGRSQEVDVDNGGRLLRKMHDRERDGGS
jgi:hypothetical protein